MSGPARPQGAWAVPGRAAFSGAHRLVAQARSAAWAFRRRRLVASLRLQGLLYRSIVHVDVAPDVRLGRRVRVAVDPHAAVTVLIGPGCMLGDDVRVEMHDGGRLELGDGVDIRRSCRLGTAGRLRIDGPTLVQDGCTIHCDEDVHIGARIALAEYATVIDSSHYHDEAGGWFVHNVASRPVRIEDDAWIGAKATVARGVVVGAGAVVSANSLVVRDVPARARASGVPAEVVRTAPPGAANGQAPEAAGRPASSSS